MTKKAFTLIELIFVIIIIGIMSAIVSTYFKDDKLALAVYQTLEHIRYTQHLAISDDKFDPKDTTYTNSGFNGNSGKYYRSWWQIRFVMQMNGIPQIVGYSVYSDKDREGNIDRTTHQEAAVNPFDGLHLNTFIAADSSPDVNLLSKYSVNSVEFSQNCQAIGFTKIQNDIGAIVFDEKGRPYRGITDTNSNNPYLYRLTSNCDITLTQQDGRQAVITIYPETGYAEITRLD